MQEKFYTCKYDRAFKEVFLNKKNDDLLKVLLESILKVKINKIEILNNERNVDNIHVARKHVDALLDTDKGKIGIEVNTSKEDYVRPRNFAFITDVYSHYTQVGEKYNEKIDIIQINISYNLKYNELMREFRVMDNNNNLFVKNFRIYEINMDRYMKIWYDKDEKEIEKNKYLIMLNLEDEELKILSKKDKVVNKYMEEIERVNKNPKFREYISLEEDNKKIINSLKEEYEEKGIKEGEKTKTIEIAKEMLKDNIDINMISKYTNLSIDEIKELKI